MCIRDSLEHEALGGQPAERERPFDHGHETGVVELVRREVDRDVRLALLGSGEPPGARRRHGFA